MFISQAPTEYGGYKSSKDIAPGVQQHFYGNVGGLGFRFYIDKVHNIKKSDAEGIRVDDEFEMIEIPIDSKSVLRRPVSDQDRYSLVREYEAWKAGKQTAGTLVDYWDVLIERPEVISTLKFHKIFTVEQFAAAVPEKIQALPMEAREFQKLAVQEMKKAEREAENSELALRMQGELKARDEEIEKLRAEMAEFRAMKEEWAESQGLSKQAGTRVAGKQNKKV